MINVYRVTLRLEEPNGEKHDFSYEQGAESVADAVEVNSAWKLSDDWEHDARFFELLNEGKGEGHATIFVESEILDDWIHRVVVETTKGASE